MSLVIYSLGHCSDRPGFPETCQELYPALGIFFIAVLGGTAVLAQLPSVAAAALQSAPQSAICSTSFR